MTTQRFLFLVACCASFTAHAIEFTGNAQNDFTPKSCFEDPNGQNIAFPASFPAGRISGFDLNQICILYDKPQDILYVGVVTFNGSDGTATIFGDTDGDGDPGGTSIFLANEAGTDYPDLAQEEYFSLILDFDDDLSTVPEVIAGISAERSAPDGYRISEVALPHLGINFAFSNAYYGSIISSSTTGTVFSSPTSDKPHLEMTIPNFSQLPGFNQLDPNDPQNAIALVFKAGSLGDTVLGDEDMRVSFLSQNFFDTDGDDIPNAVDTDEDNDGIPNLAEQDLDLLDFNRNGLFDANELLGSGLDTDGDGEIEDEGIDFSDVDGDGLPDYQDTDSDQDSIADIDEAGTFPFDNDDNGEISPEELVLIDTSSSYTGGDNSGALQINELPNTDQDGLPDFRDKDSDGDGILDSVEAGDSDPASPPIDSDSDGIQNFRDLDSDNDGLSDEKEIVLGTDPINKNSDGDQVNDGDEILGGSDPLDPQSEPLIPGGLAGQGVPQIQGSGLGSCRLSPSSPSPNFFHLYYLVLFIPWLSYRFKKKILVLVLPLIMASTNGFALNVEQFRPNFDSLGLVNLLDSQVLPQKAYSFGLAISFAAQPLEVGVQGTGQRLSPLLDNQVGLTLSGAYGLTDRLELGVTIPFYPSFELTPLGTTNTQNNTAFGDVGAHSKFHFWDKETKKTKMGLALSTHVSLPTGSAGEFTRDETLTGSLKLNYDIDVKNNKFVSHLGIRFREKEVVNNLTIGQEMLWGVGFTRPILPKYDFHFVTEVNGSVALNGFLTRENRAPLEWFFGLRQGFLDHQFLITAGATLGITTGYGTPDYRVFSMISYQGSPLKTREKKEKPPEKWVKIEGSQIAILRPILFATARWEILLMSFPVLDGVTSLLKSNTEIRHVVIKGHTDHRDDDAYNKDLSEKRAKAVRDYLINKGIDPSRLSSEGWGELQPIDPSQSEEAMAKNRRVEFHIRDLSMTDASLL